MTNRPALTGCRQLSIQSSPVKYFRVPDILFLSGSPAGKTLRCIERVTGGITQRRNVPFWRDTKHSCVFAAELGGAFIADGKRCGCHIPVFVQHQTPRFIKPQPFLITQRTHASQLSEMMMERGRTHLNPAGKFLDPQRGRKVHLEPVNGFADPVAVPVHCRYLPEAIGLNQEYQLMR